MTTRQLPTIGTDPGGVSGDAYTVANNGSVRELWKLLGGVLTNVSGTNAITGDLEFGGASFDGHSNGLKFSFVAPATNTGAMTVSIQGVTAVPLKDIKDAEIAAGAVTQGMICFCQIVGSTAYLVSTGASSAAATSSGVVKKAWTLSKDTGDVRDGTFTLITIGGAQGELGDILRLPPLFFISGRVGNVASDAEVRNTTGCHLYYDPSSSNADTTDIDIMLYRDDSLLQTLFRADKAPNGTLDLDHVPFPGFIDIQDSNSHDYSIRVTTNSGAVRSGGIFNGIAELISQPAAAV